MWDLQLSRPFGTRPMRNVCFFLATMLVAAFGYIFVSAPNAYAADVTWAGNSINFEGNQYQKIVDETTQNTTNLPAGTHYGYIDGQQKAHVISFPAGADPANTTSVEYALYDFVPPGTYNNKTNTRTVSIEAPTPANQGVMSCNSDATRGIGWVICPVTNWLAGAMDWLYGLLTNFLKVRPAQTNSDNALYRSWSMMRNFANILFVIGFMLIIYSQLTSFGISNYGIKRVLPRLIVAAILVNVSYWICAIAIDISNILGYSIQDIFIAMRNSIVGPGQGNSWTLASWESVTGFILSGGTALAAATLGIRALTAASVGNALYMLLPILVGVLMAVLVALLILAARQAIITVLVILAPLAFVAYLLPNTEKYFDKWRGLFMTMLLVFPMFSVLFGGSQLAGLAIIQNADSINLVILGMAVQVAPVVITPFLVKFSGSLLGRIAGMVNNPNRGAIDRTRKWASERGGQHRDRVLAKRNPNWMNRRTQGMERKRLERDERQAAHKTIAEARRTNEKSYADIKQAALEAAQIKETGDTRATSRYEAAKRVNPLLQQTDLEARASKQDLETSQAATNLDWENMKAGRTDGLISASTVAQSGLAMNVRNNTERSQALGSALHSAQHMQQHNFAKELERDAGLRAFAGGIDPSGALKAEARAVSELGEASTKDVQAGKALLDYKAINENTTLKEKSKTIVEDVINGAGAQYDKNEIEAALEAQANEGAISILQAARLSPQMDQGMVTRVFARNAGTLKSKGGFHLQANPNISTIEEMNAASVNSLASTSAANMKELKEGWLIEMATKMTDPSDTIIADADDKHLQKVYENVYTALNNEEVWGDITDRAEYIQAIEKELRGRFGGATPPAHGI